MNATYEMFDAIEAMTETEVLDPFAHGQSDALNGKPMREGQWEQMTQMYEYSCAYREMVDTLAFADYVEECEFWRRGGA